MIWKGRAGRNCRSGGVLLLAVGIQLRMVNLKPSHTQPGGFVDKKSKPDDEVTNDSLGTVDPADSTGSDESLETGDAKARNKDTHED